ncbi:MAG: 2-phospho-L-lactate transferase CofD family protein, partial [Oceanidesulfovibrio sp.]
MPNTERIKVCHTVALPDPVKLARYERSPELGPRVLFFSGGTALRDFSRRLVRYTHNSIHIITPFDSGGSSAELRRAFNMIAVGDVRNRLMALSDRLPGADPAIFNLFAYRLPKDESQETLREMLYAMRDGKDPRVGS